MSFFVLVPNCTTVIGTTPSYYGYQSVMLKGEVPPEFQFLTHLMRVVMPGMMLTGPILAYVTNMPKLVTLSIPDNNFTGSFSSNFTTDHVDLINLDLSRNQFSGKIPPGFDNLANLQEVQLEGNKFAGLIPEDLGASNVGT